jgi:hypothetical protein
MNAISNYFRQAAIAVAAFAITASLMVGSFAADPQVQSLGGVIA